MARNFGLGRWQWGIVFVLALIGIVYNPAVHTAPTMYTLVGAISGAFLSGLLFAYIVVRSLAFVSRTLIGAVRGPPEPAAES